MDDLLMDFTTFFKSTYRVYIFTINMTDLLKKLVYSIIILNCTGLSLKSSVIVFRTKWI